MVVMAKARPMSYDDIKEENRGYKLAWTEEDNIRLVSSLANYLLYVS
jgi:hypothetical protein